MCGLSSYSFISEVIIMKVLILHKDGTFETTTLNCRGKDVEVVSWGVLNESITSRYYSNNIMCIYDDAFGWNIFNEDNLAKHINKYVAKIFGKNTDTYNDVVITSIRNGKPCSIRNKDINYIKEVISHEKAIRKSE